jgi:hypothetical protein
MPGTTSGQNALDDYKELYIAFLDLLGFKSQVEDAEKEPAAHDKLRAVLRLVRESLCENPSINFRLNYFSDCIVISAERTPQGLREMFNSICLLTSDLMQHDVLIRGGLAAGRVHHSEEFLYGAAFNHAYTLESKDAHDPMVLLSDEVFEDARKYGQQHMGFLAEQNGRWFIYFLLQYALYRPMPIYQGKVILDRPGARVVNYICQRLNKDRGSIRAKAEWILAYWNETVAVHGVFGTIEEGVAEQNDLGGPTTAVRRLYMGDLQPKM